MVLSYLVSPEFYRPTTHQPLAVGTPEASWLVVFLQSRMPTQYLVSMKDIQLQYIPELFQ